MDSDQFESRLRELESLAGSTDTMTLFNASYEALLEEVNGQPGPRYRKLERMQRLVYKQTAWLMNELLRAKAIDAMGQPEETSIGTGMN